MKTQSEVETEKISIQNIQLWGECMVFLSFKAVKLIAGIYFIGQ